MTLQLALVLAGFILFVGVYAISRWQAERHLPKARNQPPQLGNEPDSRRSPLMSEDEPEPGPEDEDQPPPEPDSEPDPQPQAKPRPKAKPAPKSKTKSKPESQPESESSSNPPDDAAENTASAPGFVSLGQIDYWVVFRGERPVSRDAVLAVFREAASGLTHHHSIYGLAPGGEWRSLANESEEARFTDLVVVLQLADLSGPVDRTEMRHFTNMVQRLSEATGRGFTFMAEVSKALEQAKALTEFIRSHERTMFLTVKPAEGQTLSGRLVENCATNLGLEADDRGFFTRYKLIEKRRVALYSLANTNENGRFDWDSLAGESLTGVTFFTYPALHPKPAAVFAEMVDTAKAFAARSTSEVHSPYGELKADQIETIRAELEKLAEEMSAKGIKPGGEQARRLFSSPTG